jgi:RNA polymerase sigma-70 factor, ECF subfamily
MFQVRLSSGAMTRGLRPDAGAPPSPDKAGGAPLDVEAAYCAHVEDVARWARRLGGPTAEVEDIVHEVFLVVQRRVGEWRGDARITTWLYEITLRVVRDRRRRWRWPRWSWTASSAGFEVSGPGRDPTELASDQPDALDLLQRREATTLLYRILDGIGEKYRTVIILFELEGLSGEEIAKLTKTSLSNVWVRLFRARQKVLKGFLAWEAKGKR